MTDRDNASTALAGFIADVTTNPVDTAKQIAKRRKLQVPLSDGGTAGSASGEVNFFRADVAVKVVSVHYDGGVAITADNTNNAAFLVQKRPVSGPGTPATVASATTAITDPVFGSNYVADTPLALTLSATAANLSLAAGDILTAKATKGGTGVAFGAAATAKGAQAYLHVVIEEL